MIETLRSENVEQLFIIVHPLIDQKKNLFDFFYDSKHFVLSLKWLSCSVRLGRICYPNSFVFTSTKAKIGKINFKISSKMLDEIILKKTMQEPVLNLLTGQRVFISKTGMTSDEVKIQKMLVNVLGGLYFHHFHEGLVNMVVVKKPNSLLAESIVNVYHQLELVNVDYFKDCLLYKRRLPVEEYSFHDLDLLIKSSYLLEKRDDAADENSRFLAATQGERFGFEEMGHSNFEKQQSSRNESFFYPSRGPRPTESSMGHNMTNYYSNSRVHNPGAGLMKEASQGKFEDSVQNNSTSFQFKSMRDQSQKSLIDVPFKSFLFEKCLFYFYDKKHEAFKFKKMVLEHSGSIVKNYKSLTSKQISGRDFFMIFDDGFDYREVNYLSRGVL